MKIIAFEGPDKFGKTTQARKLAESINAEYVKFPNEKIWSGRQIRKILNKELPFEPASFQTLQIINRMETFQLLIPNKTFVFDRYKLSGIVYGLCDGLPTEWIRNVCDFLPNPDLTIILTGEPFGQDTDIYSKQEYQAKILGLYKREGRKAGGEVCWIDNQGSVEDIHKKIMGFVGSVIQ